MHGVTMKFIKFHLQMLTVDAANFETNYRDGVLVFLLCIYLTGYHLCLV